MLLGNQSTLMKCPVRFMAGSASSVEPQLRCNWNRAGRNRNQIYRDQRSADELYGVAPGLYAGYTWLIPQRNGAMASHDNTVFGMTATGTLYGGVTATAPATFDISTNTPAGELVSTVQPGAAPSTFGFTTNTPELTASISGDNVGQSCDIGFSTNTPILGAIASLTITPTSFGFDGALTSYAIGIMSGTTAEAGVTVDNVVNGVWNALVADYLNVGSTGAALNAAGGAGDPWITTLPGAYAAGSAGDIIGNLLTNIGTRLVDGGLSQDEVTRLMASVLAGKVSGAGTGTEVFRDINDTKDRVTATVDSSGNRTAITLDGT